MQNNNTRKGVNETNAPACMKQHVLLTLADLPLACPPRNTSVWDAHPRVYLPIAETGRVICPYCGTEYELKDFSPLEK